MSNDFHNSEQATITDQFVDRDMCGRTSLFIPQSVLEDQFDATAVDPITPRYTAGMFFTCCPADSEMLARN